MATRTQRLWTDWPPTDEAPPLAPELPGAIAELRCHPQWVAWKYRDRGEGKKPTKVPVNSHTGTNAATDDPFTWACYEQAANRAKADRLAGIKGFVLSDDDNLTGYDFDNCRNPDTGHIRPWAREILSHGETYAEVRYRRERA